MSLKRERTAGSECCCCRRVGKAGHLAGNLTWGWLGAGCATGGGRERRARSGGTSGICRSSRGPLTHGRWSREALLPGEGEYGPGGPAGVGL